MEVQDLMEWGKDLVAEIPLAGRTLNENGGTDLTGCSRDALLSQGGPFLPSV